MCAHLLDCNTTTTINVDKNARKVDAPWVLPPLQRRLEAGPNQARAPRTRNKAKVVAATGK
jgi:hypothetical protein